MAVITWISCNFFLEVLRRRLVKIHVDFACSSMKFYLLPEINFQSNLYGRNFQNDLRGRKKSSPHVDHCHGWKTVHQSVLVTLESVRKLSFDFRSFNPEPCGQAAVDHTEVETRSRYSETRALRRGPMTKRRIVNETGRRGSICLRTLRLIRESGDAPSGPGIQT